MKVGGIYKFSCPKDLDIGGPSSHRGYKMGTSEPIEGNMSYIFEVIEAGRNPPMLEKLH